MTYSDAIAALESCETGAELLLLLEAISEFDYWQSDPSVIHCGGAMCAPYVTLREHVLLWINTVFSVVSCGAPVSYTHLTLPTIYSV